MKQDFFKFDEKVDCVVGNPPFTPMKVGYDILNKCFELSDNIIFLMPWLALINSEKRTQLYMERGLKKIVHLPRKAFPGSRLVGLAHIQKRGICCSGSFLLCGHRIRGFDSLFQNHVGRGKPS